MARDVLAGVDNATIRKWATAYRKAVLRNSEKIKERYASDPGYRAERIAYAKKRYHEMRDAWLKLNAKEKSRKAEK